MNPVKPTINGKVSVTMTDEEWTVMIHALRQRMARLTKADPVELWWLLEETLERVEDNRRSNIQLTKAQFFALFSPETMRHTDEPFQNITKRCMEPLRQQFTKDVRHTQNLYRSLKTAQNY
ncbi:hypothetical protein [Phaeodactylibacter xiamenensis]|uniref:hypothetical protein n=1 Tax=Phaeodactylibacter xiamenensis TaxID=1524460 RepID=UPI003BABC68C